MADVVRTIAGGQSRWPCAKDWRRCHRKRSERGLSNVPVSSHAESQGIAENRRRRGSTIRRCDAGLGRLQPTRTTRARRPRQRRQRPKSPGKQQSPPPRTCLWLRGRGPHPGFHRGKGPRWRCECATGRERSSPSCSLACWCRMEDARRSPSALAVRLSPAACRLRNWSPYRACGAHGPPGFPKATTAAMEASNQTQHQLMHFPEP